MKKMLLLLSLSLLCLVSGVVIGSTSLSWKEIGEIFAYKLWELPTQVPSTYITILWNIRIPRVLLAFIVGGALGVSGAIAQSLLQNPLASPYTLGVSSGASFGAALVMLCSFTLPVFPQLSQMCFAFLFAVVSILLVLALSYHLDSTMSNTSVVLTGMVLSLFFNGLLTVIISLSPEESSKMVQWSMGSFAMRGWDYVKLLSPVVLLGILLSLAMAQELDLFSFGTQEASSMGVSSGKIKILAFMNMAMMTGACIAITGTIGFVDLIAPHVARKFLGNRHIVLLPASFLVGGTLMTVTDTFARSVLSPSELSVGAVTALLGAPFFFYVYQGQKGGK